MAVREAQEPLNMVGKSWLLRMIRLFWRKRIKEVCYILPRSQDSQHGLKTSISDTAVLGDRAGLW